MRGHRGCFGDVAWFAGDLHRTVRAARKRFHGGSAGNTRAVSQLTALERSIRQAATRDRAGRQRGIFVTGGLYADSGRRKRGIFTAPPRAAGGAEADPRDTQHQDGDEDAARGNVSEDEGGNGAADDSGESAAQE